MRRDSKRKIIFPIYLHGDARKELTDRPERKIERIAGKRERPEQTEQYGTES
jgi:hypothetical protein